MNGAARLVEPGEKSMHASIHFFVEPRLGRVALPLGAFLFVISSFVNGNSCFLVQPGRKSVFDDPSSNHQPKVVWSDPTNECLFSSSSYD